MQLYECTDKMNFPREVYFYDWILSKEMMYNYNNVAYSSSLLPSIFHPGVCVFIHLVSHFLKNWSNLATLWALWVST